MNDSMEVFGIALSGMQSAQRRIDQIIAATQYSASARVFSVGAEMRGTRVDMLG